MDFRLLGPLEVVDDDGVALPLGGPRPRALLAQLLLHPNEVVSTDRLIDGIWGETPPASAANALQVHVHALRGALGADRILTRPPGYLLRVEEGELDAQRFEQLVADHDPRRALALWRGPALADLANEPFARAEAARLDDARLGALEARIDLDLADGRHATLTAELDALVTDHPHRERLRAQQMLALYRSGRQADALAAYRDARSALDELGLEPSAELRALEQQILRQDPDARSPRGPREVRRRRAVTRYASSWAESSRSQPSRALLERADTRLVTLTGRRRHGEDEPRARGGSNARRRRRRLRRSRPRHGSRARRPRRSRRRSRSTRNPATGRGDAHGGRRRPRSTPRARQLRASPRRGRARGQAAPLRAGASRRSSTSRAPLHLDGRARVPGRAAADSRAARDTVSALEGVESVRLFVQRAEAVMPGFELSDDNAASVARICRALDGLPLAIELAAARIRVLGPDGMAQRLGERLALLTRRAPDLAERQRSLRATIEWSVRLLDEPARAAFGAVGVFAAPAWLASIERSSATWSRTCRRRWRHSSTPLSSFRRQIPRASRAFGCSRRSATTRSPTSKRAGPSPRRVTGTSRDVVDTVSRWDAVTTRGPARSRRPRDRRRDLSRRRGGSPPRTAPSAMEPESGYSR